MPVKDRFVVKPDSDRSLGYVETSARRFEIVPEIDLEAGEKYVVEIEGDSVRVFHVLLDEDTHHDVEVKAIEGGPH